MPGKRIHAKRGNGSSTSSDAYGRTQKNKIVVDGE
jgi:hypothetical protein